MPCKDILCRLHQFNLHEGTCKYGTTIFLVERSLSASNSAGGGTASEAFLGKAITEPGSHTNYCNLYFLSVPLTSKGQQLLIQTAVGLLWKNMTNLTNREVYTTSFCFERNLKWKKIFPPQKEKNWFKLAGWKYFSLFPPSYQILFQQWFANQHSICHQSDTRIAEAVWIS